MKSAVDITKLGESAFDGNERAKHCFQYSGRVYLYGADDRWITGYDDVYGAAYYQNAESGGTGVEPLIEWEHQGHMINAGDTVENLRLRGRITDANTIEDLQIYVVYTRPDTPNRSLVTGLDNDGEDVHTILWRGNWISGVATVGDDVPALTGARNDQYIREIPIDFTAPEFGDLKIYFKPQSFDPRPNTTNDYFYQSHSWGILSDVV